MQQLRSSVSKQESTVKALEKQLQHTTARQDKSLHDIDESVSFLSAELDELKSTLSTAVARLLLVQLHATQRQLQVKPPLYKRTISTWLLKSRFKGITAKITLFFLASGRKETKT